MKKTSKKSKKTKPAKVVPENDGQRIWAQRAAYGDDVGPREAVNHRELTRETLDEPGRQRTITKTLPYIEKLYKRGKIDRDMLIVAHDFYRDYNTARIDPLRAAQLERSGGGGYNPHGIDEPLRVAAARSRILKIRSILARGKDGIRRWEALENVVGREFKVTEVADNRGNKYNQLVDHLCAALAVILSFNQGYAAAHYKKLGVKKTY